MSDRSGTAPWISVVVATDGTDAGRHHELVGDAARSGGTSVEVVTPDETGADRWTVWDAGVRQASGTWVLLMDGRDRLEDGFVDAIGAQLERLPSDVVIAVVPLVGQTAEGEVVDAHGLRQRFADGTRVVVLDEDSAAMPVHAGSTLVRRTWWTRARATAVGASPWGDAMTLGLALLGEEAPKVAVVSGPAVRHVDAEGRPSPILPRLTTSDDVEKVAEALAAFDERLRAMYPRNGVPAWVQDLIVYELSWYAQQNRFHPESFSAMGPEALTAFRRSAADVLDHVDRSRIWHFALRPLDRAVRLQLVAAQGRGLRPTSVHVVDVEPAADLALVLYEFSGPRPRESWYVDGHEVRVVDGKYRTVSVWGEPMLVERRAWVPRGKLAVTLDGDPVAPMTGAAPSKGPSLAVKRPPAHGRGDAARGSVARRVARRVRGRLPDSRPSSRFTRAWTLMDRAAMANDNAEHLYRYLAAHRPDINAWFVLDRASGDWGRLEEEGFRLVAFRSEDHLELLRETEHYASSHIDPYVFRPFADVTKDHGRWRFTFLQHGVTKDDVSSWFNGKAIDRIVTATHAEHRSIAADGSPYRFGERETRLTGFPRHDALLRKARSATPEHVAVLPTWRQSLVASSAGDPTLKVLRPDVTASPFVQAWTELLRSEELRDLLDSHGLGLFLLPHPTMSGAFDHLRESKHLTISTYADADVQDVVARSAAVVTDYSSIAFDAAFAGRPLAYYQFEGGRDFGGGHFYSQGYFDYRSDGFGPVCESAEETVSALRTALSPAEWSATPYPDRVGEAFAYVDEGACARVVAMMEELTPVGGV